MNPRTLSSGAQRALQDARAEAQRLGHDSVGAEHIVLGLLRPGGPATAILERLKLDPAKVRERLEAGGRKGRPRGGGDELAYTWRCRGSSGPRSSAHEADSGAPGGSRRTSGDTRREALECPSARISSMPSPSWPGPPPAPRPSDADRYNLLVEKIVRERGRLEAGLEARNEKSQEQAQAMRAWAQDPFDRERPPRH